MAQPIEWGKDLYDIGSRTHIPRTHTDCGPEDEGSVNSEMLVILPALKRTENPRTGSASTMNHHKDLKSLM
jgi:hypothetical protein